MTREAEVNADADKKASELITARKAQAKDRVLLLGTMLSEIKNREIELNRDLTDEDVV